MAELYPVHSSESFAFVAREGHDWGASACEYAHYSRQIGFYIKITEALVQLVPHAWAQMVDFGCGDGRFTRALLGRSRSDARPATAYLVDKFEEMLVLTSDLEKGFANACFVRVQDTDGLNNLPKVLNGAVDVFACNSSFHLLRDALGFVKRALFWIRAGGCFIANIPDQDFDFSDGWSSEFSRHANYLMPLPSRQAISPKFNREVLCELARLLGCHLEIHEVFFSVTWTDFVAFYSIPFMGAKRLPALNQQQRIQHLSNLDAPFEIIQYRWAFLKLTKPV